MPELYKADVVDVDLHGNTIEHTVMRTSIFEDDNMANQFGVSVFRDGSPVDLTGVSCVGYFIRHSVPDTVVVGGAIDENATDNNIAYVRLPKACFSFEGNFSLFIKLSFSGNITTVRVIEGYVVKTHTGELINPTTSGQVYALETALRQIQYVSDVNIVSNETNATVDGVPAHSIWVIMRGGSSSNVAKTIYLNKPDWVGTYGSTSGTYVDENGVSHTVYFSRASALSCQFSVVITKQSGYDSTTEQNIIKNAVVEYCEKHNGIGEQIKIKDLVGFVESKSTKYTVTGIAVSSSVGSSSTIIETPKDKYVLCNSGSLITIVENQ